MLTFKLGYGPGQWKPLLIGNKRAAAIYCPECGRPITLTRHTIDETGRVSPTVQHDPQNNACPWHAEILLEGWQGS